MSKIVIFDLDGTLNDIDQRRKNIHVGGGKIDWDFFFDPSNVFRVTTICQ